MIVDVVVPAGIDDPTLPSGGNTYDRRVCRGLAESGWVVHEHRLAGAWPTPEEQHRRALTASLETVPDGRLVLVDGLVGSAAPEQLSHISRRSRIVVLVHLPLGVSCPDSATAAREREALERADALIVTSPWTRDWLGAHYGLAADRIHLAEPGADPADLTHPSTSGHRLLCVGAIAPHKGQDVLVAALTRLADCSWRCRLVGAEVDATQGWTVRAQVASAGLQERVEVTGPLTPSVLAGVYADTDLLVVPSRTESYGMVVLEALARGIPVVATTAGGLPGTVGLDGEGLGPGLLVPVDDPGRLAEILRRWLQDDDLRRRLRTAARERRRALRPWSQTANRVAATLRGLAA